MALHLTEPEGSTLSILKPATWHDPEPVPSSFGHAIHITNFYPSKLYEQFNIAF
jgi:hypothetical protein